MTEEKGGVEGGRKESRGENRGEEAELVVKNGGEKERRIKR